MKHKLFEYVLYYVLIGWLLGGCGALQTANQIAPLANGEVSGLYEGTARWLSSGGDMIVHTFYNVSTGVVVHTRSLANGFAIGCESARWREVLPVAYLVNRATYVEFVKDLVSTRGFVEVFASLPPVPIITIVAMPVLSRDLNNELMYRSLGLAIENDAGVYVGSRIPFLDSEFSDVSATWEAVYP